MVKEVASKTSDVAGDGTTTATLIAQSIYKEGIKLVAAGHDPMKLKRGIDKAVEVVVDSIQKSSKQVKGRTEIAQVATISANGDDAIGNIIADAMEKVGKGKLLDNGSVRPLDVKVGDKVLFSKYGGNDINIDGDEFLIMREEDILAIIK